MSSSHTEKLAVVYRAPDGACEICNNRPGTKLVSAGGCEAWACFRCRGIDPADYGEDDFGNPLPDEEVS